MSEQLPEEIRDLISDQSAWPMTPYFTNAGKPWFTPESDKPKHLTTEEISHLEHYRTTAIRAVDDVYRRALISGELPHSMNVTAYFDGHYEGQDIRINGSDDDAEEESEEITDDIPPEIRTFVCEKVNEVLTERTLPDWPVYFMNGEWLVTYGWAMKERQATLARTTELSQRIFELECQATQTTRQFNTVVAAAVVLMLCVIAQAVFIWLR